MYTQVRCTPRYSVHPGTVYSVHSGKVYSVHPSTVYSVHSGKVYSVHSGKVNSVHSGTVSIFIEKEIEKGKAYLRCTQPTTILIN